MVFSTVSTEWPYTCTVSHAHAHKLHQLPRLCLEMERERHKGETGRGWKDARGRNLLDGRPVLGSVHFNGPLQRFLLCRIPSLPHALFATRRRSISCPTAINTSNASAQGNRHYRFLICETSLASTAKETDRGAGGGSAGRPPFKWL
jgi:hypothetical protein